MFNEKPVNSVNTQPNDHQELDQLTGGAFFAPTSGERATRIRAWLNTEPSVEQLNHVYREISVRDKGVAKILREKLDEIKRAKNQDMLAQEWCDKANKLIETSRLNIADAMAWQRDAAKAGAPLSREPLASLKNALADRVKNIENLQHRTQVQRESAVLMVQRIEVLSTKPWQEAQEQSDVIHVDLQKWHGESESIAQHSDWPSVDTKFPPIIQSSAQHVNLVWDAFKAALDQTQHAFQDPSHPLPAVPAWADQIRSARGQASASSANPANVKPKVDPEQRAQAQAAVLEVLTVLEKEVVQGHGKATAAASASLRQALKTHGRWIDENLDQQAQKVLSAATELEGWQRWRADQIRNELLTKAESLLKNDVPIIGGRKLQEALRDFREAWKQTDSGGVPNHALWKKFDAACNRAYPFVQEWLDKMRAEAATHRQQRLDLIEELKAWTLEHAQGPDWRQVHRSLHEFSERWRSSGHMNEKMFAELQATWREAMNAVHASIAAVEKASIQRREALIAEATQIGSADFLNIDAVKDVQHRWQVESQTIPLERKLAQNLWDAFRKPLDEAFNRKTQQRERGAQAANALEQAVLDASIALEQATQSGDAAQIKQALYVLNQAVLGKQVVTKPVEAPPVQAPVVEAEVKTEDVQATTEEAQVSPEASQETTEVAKDASHEPEASEPAKPASAKPAKPVIAVRGDDRPGQKKTESLQNSGFGQEGKPPLKRNSKDAPPSGKWPEREERGPRLSDPVYRAQRQAFENAEIAMRRLSAQAHGEVLTNLMSAWLQRQAEAVPAVKELGANVNSAQRQSWTQALQKPVQALGANLLLRLEIASNLSTPPHHAEARRAYQLHLLTKRNDPPPAQTWAQDVARIFEGAYTEDDARRVQSALKVLMRKS
ncbi:MAG: DUF349 domain-containing protein [Limnohabitans sp.]|nr:DUF349 domain-containing protein [Limnohabitans sp.]